MLERNTISTLKPLVATEFILRTLNVNFTTLYVYKYKATSEAQNILSSISRKFGGHVF